jgi:6,7-dimethyl-8-ribityllumazine synthase
MNRIDEPEGQGDEGTWAPESGEDFERASENVLDGWPTSSPGETQDEPSDGLPLSSEAAVELEVEPEPDADADPEPDAEPESDVHVDPDADGALPDALEEEDEVADEVAVTSSVLDEPAPGEVVETSSEHAPGQLDLPPGYAVLEGQPQGRRRAVGIVVSRFNGEVTGGLLASALEELGARGVGPDSITVMPVPGAFELPIAAMALAKTRRFACIVALGCVIRGDTPHFDYVAGEAASGLQLAAIETGVPVAFGVLTLERLDQAEPRISKGAEAVRTALEMADLFANLRTAAAR